jgi:hypothetical protein
MFQIRCYLWVVYELCENFYHFYYETVTYLWEPPTPTNNSSNTEHTELLVSNMFLLCNEAGRVRFQLPV